MLPGLDKVLELGRQLLEEISGLRADLRALRESLERERV